MMGEGENEPTITVVGASSPTSNMVRDEGGEYGMTIAGVYQASTRKGTFYDWRCPYCKQQAGAPRPDFKAALEDYQDHQKECRPDER